MKGRRIAVLCGEGRHASWPADLEVSTYDSTARDAAKVAGMMKAETVDAVVIANKEPNSQVLRLMPKNLCPVFLWKRSLPALASSLHEVVGLPRMPVLVPEKQPDKAAKRDPKWSTEENEAVVLAYSESGDNALMFHAVYNELVERERSLAELWLHCDALRKRGYLQAPEAFIQALKDSASLSPAPVSTEVDDAHPADDIGALLKRSVAAGILTVDEAIDRALKR